MRHEQLCTGLAGASTCRRFGSLMLQFPHKPHHPMPNSIFTLGTRGSRLARWQAHLVQQQLEEAGATVNLVEISTRGDRVQETPLSQMDDEALFTRELDRALLDGRIDLAVHSLKDIPTEIPKEIVIAATGERAEPWDVFIAHPSFGGDLEDLPEGAQVATSSLRRKAQLKAWRADIQVPPVRGNVPTRLDTLNDSAWHGMVQAAAGLVRLGMEDRIRERINPGIMLPAVSQGALGIACRRDDEVTRAALQANVHHEPTGVAARCERAYLRRLEGGCQVPIGAHARLDGQGVLVMEGCIASLDGSRLVRDQARGEADAPEKLGTRLAEELLKQGGRAILAEVRSAASS